MTETSLGTQAGEKPRIILTEIEKLIAWEEVRRPLFIAEQLRDPNDQNVVNSLLQQGIREKQEGNTDIAKDLLKESFVEASKIVDLSERTNAFLSIAGAYKQIGDLTESKNSCLEAWGCNYKVGDLKKQTINLVRIGEMESSIQYYPEFNFQDAIKFAKIIADDTGIDDNEANIQLQEIVIAFIEADRVKEGVTVADTLRPSNSEALVGIIYRLLDKGCIPEALKYMEKVDDKDTYRFWIDHLTGDRHRVFTPEFLIESQLSLDVKTALQILEVANQMDFEYIVQFIEQMPGDSPKGKLLTLAIDIQLKKDPPNSLKILQQAHDFIKRNPNIPEQTNLLIFLISRLVGANDIAQAEEISKEVEENIRKIAGTKEGGPSKISEAEMYIDIGNLERAREIAISHLGQMNIEEKKADELVRIGLIFEILGEKDQASIFLKKAIQVGYANTQNEYENMNAALLLLKKGHSNEGKVMARAAKTLNQRNALVMMAVEKKDVEAVFNLAFPLGKWDLYRSIYDDLYQIGGEGTVLKFAEGKTGDINDEAYIYLTKKYMEQKDKPKIVATAMNIKDKSTAGIYLLPNLIDAGYAREALELYENGKIRLSPEEIMRCLAIEGRIEAIPSYLAQMQEQDKISAMNELVRIKSDKEIEEYVQRYKAYRSKYENHDVDIKSILKEMAIYRQIPNELLLERLVVLGADQRTLDEFLRLFPGDKQPDLRRKYSYRSGYFLAQYFNGIIDQETNDLLLSSDMNFIPLALDWDISHPQRIGMYLQNFQVIQELLKHDPERQIITYLHETFGISNFSRFPNEVLIDIYNDREDLTKPYGLIIVGKADHNGALSQNKDKYLDLYRQIKDTHNLRIIEAGKDFMLLRILLRLQKKYGRKVGFRLINAHGSPEQFYLGNGKDDVVVIADFDKKISAYLKDNFYLPAAPSAYLSCSTGQPNGIADKDSETFETKSIGPKTPTSAKEIVAIFNDEGRIDSLYVQYKDEGAAQDYSKVNIH